MIPASVSRSRGSWWVLESADTNIILSEQHGAEKLTPGYELSKRPKARANAREADKYLKRLDPKAEAGKL
jgi:hypothetical protein